MQLEAAIGESVFDISLDREQTTAVINDEEISYQIVSSDEEQILFRIGNKLHKISNIQVNGAQVECSVDGKWITATLKNEQELLLERLGFKTNAEKSAGSVQAPMPGKILELLIEEGAEVKLGDPVIILEAMKMENELKAPCTGTISDISVSVGTNVEKNQPLLEIDPRG